MRNTDTVSVLTDIVRKVKEASDLAPVLETRRYQVPNGYQVDAPHGGVSRPVEDVLVAQQERGVMVEIDRAVTNLNQARQNLDAAVDAMHDALAKWESNR